MSGQILSIFQPRPTISVVIPTYNEAERIASTVKLAKSRAHCHAEILVADGNSTDETKILARRAGARVFGVSGGRAAQLNTAASHARSEKLLFLHADTQVPEGYDAEMQRVLDGPAVAGAFRLKIDSKIRGIKIVSAVANWRARFLQRPYGDQGLFMNRKTFDLVGGYPKMSFLDDYEMVRRIVKRGRIGIANSSVVTSARRWETLGVLRTTLMNQVIIAGYHFGVPVDTLRDWYRGVLIRAQGKRPKQKGE